MQARVETRAINPPADPASARPARRREGRQRPPYPARVLIVEEDRRLAHSLRRGLEEVGLAAETAHDGAGALRLARDGGYQVVVLDVDLSGGDGFEVCSALRAREVGSAILLLTPRGAGRDRLAGLRAGADAHLVKPFALHELVATVRSLAPRARGEPQECLRAGPLRLEPAARLVKVEDHAVELTGKEFDILEFFLLHPDRVLHQRRILENVWSYDFAGGRNLVEVYMGRLRRKLGQAGLGDPFVTVRGAGYRLRAPEPESLTH